jgi:hypothetical protein
VVDGAVANHLEILRVALRRGIGVCLIKGVIHSHAFGRLLLDPVDRIRRRDAGGLYLLILVADVVRAILSNSTPAPRFYDVIIGDRRMPA